jgi:hypothetical protein
MCSLDRCNHGPLPVRHTHDEQEVLAVIKALHITNGGGSMPNESGLKCDKMWTNLKFEKM